MQDEVKFPIIFDTCPSCGGKKRVVETVLSQEKEKGRINPNAQAALRQQITIIAEPAKVVLSAPAVMVSYDICADCGTEYCIRADLITATPQMRPSGPKPDLRGLGFPQQDPRWG